MGEGFECIAKSFEGLAASVTDLKGAIQVDVLFTDQIRTCRAL